MKTEEQLKDSLKKEAWHYRHACKKHPNFAIEEDSECFFYTGEKKDVSNFKKFAQIFRHEFNQGEVSAYNVLKAEIIEMFDDVREEHWENAIYESYDVGAVLERMRDIFKERLLKKENMCKKFAHMSPESPYSDKSGEQNEQKTLHPDYYTRNGIEVNSVIDAFDLNFRRGTALSYICRAGKKDPAKEIEDLKKAVCTLQSEIDRMEELKNGGQE